MSRKLQANNVISYCFYLYLILHVYAARFDITKKSKKKFAIFLGTKQNLITSSDKKSHEPTHIAQNAKKMYDASILTKQGRRVNENSERRGGGANFK